MKLNTVVDICKAIAENKPVERRHKSSNDNPWIAVSLIGAQALVIDFNHLEWRTTPKTIKYRNYLADVGENKCRVYSYNGDTSLNLEKQKYFIKWIGDWQEVEIEE